MLPMDPIAQLIEAFGGIRPTAAALNEWPNTVMNWKKTGSIPLKRHHDRREQIQAAADRLGKKLPPKTVMDKAFKKVRAA